MSWTCSFMRRTRVLDLTICFWSFYPLSVRRSRRPAWRSDLSADGNDNWFQDFQRDDGHVLKLVGSCVTHKKRLRDLRLDSWETVKASRVKHFVVIRQSNYDEHFIWYGVRFHCAVAETWFSEIFWNSWQVFRWSSNMNHKLYFYHDKSNGTNIFGKIVDPILLFFDFFDRNTSDIVISLQSL